MISDVIISKLCFPFELQLLASCIGTLSSVEMSHFPVDQGLLCLILV